MRMDEYIILLTFTFRWVDGKTGKRSDTAHGYIYNKNLKNITIQPRSKVTRVIFE